MRLLILLDIDGVLNPVARAAGPGEEPELVMSETRIALVRRLAALGRIAWVSTWPAEQRAGLERQLQLAVEPLRVPLPGSLSESDAATPKLRPVSRWLKKKELLGEAEWDAIVWIDDVLGPDARVWAHQYHQPVLLEKPLPAQGLTKMHVVAVEVLVSGDGG